MTQVSHLEILDLDDKSEIANSDSCSSSGTKITDLTSGAVPKKQASVQRASCSHCSHVFGRARRRQDCAPRLDYEDSHTRTPWSAAAFRQSRSWAHIIIIIIIVIIIIITIIIICAASVV